METSTSDTEKAGAIPAPINSDEQRITIALFEAFMAIEERKMRRPDSRWKAELIGLYRSAESNRSQTTDEHDRHYQTGVMTACCSLWNRLTGEELINLDNP